MSDTEVGLARPGGEPASRVLQRKAFHVASIGTMAVLAAFLPRVWSLRILGGFLLAIFLAFLVVSYRPRRERREFRQATQRKDKAFPLQGTVFSLVGALAALLLFPPHVAAAGLAVLALGDSLSTLYAMKFGRVRFPWSEKRADAWVVGVLAGALAAAALVPWWSALVASAVAQIPEVVDVDDPPLWFDDNLMTPVIAGTAMVLLAAFG